MCSRLTSPRLTRWMIIYPGMMSTFSTSMVMADLGVVVPTALPSIWLIISVARTGNVDRTFLMLIHQAIFHSYRTMAQKTWWIMWPWVIWLPDTIFAWQFFPRAIAERSRAKRFLAVLPSRF